MHIFFQKIKERIKEGFSLDKRSLGVMRVFFGCVILLDTLINWNNRDAFHSDNGILPTELLNDSFAYDQYWNIYAMNIDRLSTDLLLIGQIILAGLFIFGLGTRGVTFLLWIFLGSLQSNNPLILHSGDTMMRVMLFWMIRLPIGERYSVDSFLFEYDEENTHYSVGSVGFIVQIILVYYMSYLYKAHPFRRSEFTGLYYALSLDSFRRPLLGDLLYALPGVMKLFTFFTMILEKFVIWGVLFSRKKYILRTLAVVGFISFHLGIAGSMYIELFPWTAIALWIAFLPGILWSWLLRCIHFPKMLGMSGGFLAEIESWKNLYRKKFYAFIKKILLIIGSAIILITLYWNGTELLSRFDTLSQLHEKGNSSIKPVVFVFKLQQQRSMFAPYPTNDEGWFQLIGQNVGGPMIDLLHPDGVITITKPKNIGPYYGSGKRHKYYSLFQSVPDENFLDAYMMYACNKYGMDFLEFVYNWRRVGPDYTHQPYSKKKLKLRNCTQGL